MHISSKLYLFRKYLLPGNVWHRRRLRLLQLAIQTVVPSLQSDEQLDRSGFATVEPSWSADEFFIQNDLPHLLASCLSITVAQGHRLETRETLRITPQMNLRFT
jgi:hypothetical protein